MTLIDIEQLRKEIDFSRIMGCYTQKHDGPLLLITACMHGNEPAGIIALKQVFDKLQMEEPPMKGTFYGVCCNIPAVQINERFIDEDLNRLWKAAKIEKLRSGVEEGKTSEECEAISLLNTLKEMETEKFSEKYYIDLHTTSSESIPYISVGNYELCVSFASKFPVHVVHGFSDMVEGTIDSFFCSHDAQGFTLEAGQHFDISSVENCEAMIWLALVQVGCIDSKDLPHYSHFRELLMSRMILEDKKTFKIIYRHAISPEDDFSMEPGFVNFQKIKKGELLGKDVNGKIVSQWDARILMPLYQKKGNDGFFVILEQEKQTREIL